MIELKFYKSRWKAILLILLALPFVIACLYFIINNDHDKTLDWIGLCFFGLGIPLGLFNLFDRRPEIIINEAGIFDRMGYKDFVKWHLIKDAYFKEQKIYGIYGWVVSKQKYVCLVIDPDDLATLKINKTAQKIAKSLGYHGISISLNQLQKIDEPKFVEFIKAMAHADASTRQNLLITSTL